MPRVKVLKISKSFDRHYLLCQDENCESAACVGRRELEFKLRWANATIERMKQIKKGNT